MSRLDTEERDRIPAGRFGLPKARQYPLEDKKHARIALSLASKNATSEEQAQIRRRVKRLYPGIKESK